MLSSSQVLQHALRREIHEQCFFFLTNNQSRINPCLQFQKEWPILLTTFKEHPIITTRKKKKQIGDNVCVYFFAAFVVFIQVLLIQKKWDENDKSETKIKRNQRKNSTLSHFGFIFASLFVCVRADFCI